MMAYLWGDVRRDLASSTRHFTQALALFDNGLVDAAGALNYTSTMAFQHAMLAGYTSFENAMKRLLTMLGEPIPVGSDWHAVLVRRLAEPMAGSRPALLGDELRRHTEELRRFRHVAMHSYDDFSVERAAVAVLSARTFLASADRAFETFRGIIDPD